MAIVLVLDRPDALSGEPFPLRAVVRITPPIPDVSPVIDALEGAIALGQRRYHLYRDEMPTRRAAVEAAARTVLAEGGLLDVVLLSLEPA